MKCAKTLRMLGIAIILTLVAAIPATPALAYTYDIEIDPEDSNILYATYSPKIFENHSSIWRYSKYQEENFGWSEILRIDNSTGVASIEFDASNPNTIYAGVTGEEGTLYVSYDKGETWNKLNEDFLISFLTGRDMSINFAVSALRAIFNTFSLSEIRSLSLKQNYLKNLVNLYNLLLALPQAKIKEQIVDFVKGLIKRDTLLSADPRAIDLPYRDKVDRPAEKSLDTTKPNTHNLGNESDSL